MPQLKSRCNEVITIPIDEKESIHLQPFEKIEITKKIADTVYVKAALRTGKVKLIENDALKKANVTKKDVEKGSES